MPLGVSVAGLRDETILDAARRGRVPLGNACGGIGVCGRCRVVVISGGEHLSPMTTAEEAFGARRAMERGERLACQAVVRGACAVTTSYWGAVPSPPAGPDGACLERQSSGIRGAATGLSQGVCTHHETSSVRFRLTGCDERKGDHDEDKR